MNYSKFDILIVCNGYSQRLDACLYFWEHMNYPKDSFRITISTWEKDRETLSVILKHSNNQIIEIITAPYCDLDFHHKGKMIENAYNSIKNKVHDFIIMSDADIIFNSETLNDINDVIVSSRKDEIIISSLREEILEKDLINVFFEKYQYMKNIDWPWRNLSIKIKSPSPFMGWFLSFSSKHISKIDFIKYHEGYDLIDWKILGQLLSMGLRKKILYMPDMPLHMPHGEKGANWKGIKLN